MSATAPPPDWRQLIEAGVHPEWDEFHQSNLRYENRQAIERFLESGVLHVEDRTTPVYDPKLVFEGPTVRHQRLVSEWTETPQ